MPAQPTDDLPFREIPEYPDTLTPATMLARSIEGLGFRYYWATEGLTAVDLEYRPVASARSTYETLVHIQQLARTVINVVNGHPNTRPAPGDTLPYPELRLITLKDLQTASTQLRAAPQTDLSGLEIVFETGEKRYRYPFWHLLNGQLADALYHVGQVVAFRRASGNPMPGGVSVFMGTVRD